MFDSLFGTLLNLFAVANFLLAELKEDDLFTVLLPFWDDI
jgi:hypothetical protein